MGLMHYFLGLEVWQGDRELFVSHRKYSYEIIHIFHLENCNPMDTPLAKNWTKESASSREAIDATIFRKIVGSFMYLVNISPKICYVVNQLSQAMMKPLKLYWKATKNVLRYLRGTMEYGLWYMRIEGVKIQGFTDVDWEGISLDRKRTSSAIFSVESATISWNSRKKRSMVLSSVEVEYMVES